MLKNYWRIISYLERIGDNALIIAAFFASYYLRDYLLLAANATALPFPQELLELDSIDRYFIVLGAALPLYNALLSMLGAYRSMRFIRWFTLLRISVTASALCFLCLGATLFLLKLDLSRSFIATFTIVSGMGLFLLRVFVLTLLRFFRVRGKNFRNLLVVGTGVQARKVYLEIAGQPELGVRVCGFVDVDESGLGEHRNEEEGDKGAAREREWGDSAVYDLPARVVANLESFEAALKKYAVDEVIFTEVVGHFSAVRELARIAAEEGVRVTLVADLFSLEIFQSDVSYFGKLPLIHYNPSPAGVDNPALAVKRVMDVVLSTSALVVLSPLMLFVAILIKLGSPGPVFFKQRRMGLNGRIFTLLKFRSMIENAESMLDDLRAKNEMTGPVFKLRDDPRVTSIGRFIRRYSIDELPQLINVLRGDMSLVGPRPPLPDEVSLYVRKHRRRLSMRPGLTCTWQVSGRNDIPDFEDWAKLDLEYIDNWSLVHDFKLILRTIPAVVCGSGAR